MEAKKDEEKLGQEAVYDLIEKNDMGWKNIIYDLINTEQLDPWDVDLVILAHKYLEKIKELEEANFFLSSKVLLAASLLLRIKSEVLVEKEIKSIDEILFGKKEEERELERIEIDRSKVPKLYPKTPLPRYKKISLEELMSSLDKAMKTEKRRIEKEVQEKVLEKETEIVLPKKRANVKDRIRDIYSKILKTLKKNTRVSYADLTGGNKEEMIACFLPCLHLNNQEKIFLNQEKHFDEIWILLYKKFQEQMQKEKQEIEESEEISKETGFDNPLADFFNAGNKLLENS